MSPTESAIDKLRDEGWIDEARHVEALDQTLREIRDRARNAAMYEPFWDWVVSRINEVIQPED